MAGSSKDFLGTRACRAERKGTGPECARPHGGRLDETQMARAGAAQPRMLRTAIKRRRGSGAALVVLANHHDAGGEPLVGRNFEVGGRRLAQIDAAGEVED